MKILKGKRVYLSSPMEHCENSSWRHDVKKTLKESYGLKVFDPYDDPKQEAAKEIHTLKAQKNYDRLRKIAKDFVRKDLSIVDRADIVIAHVPYKVPTTGVTHEIINSNNAKKITLLVEGTDKSKITTWYFGFIPDDFMFGPWNDLFTFLDQVDNGCYKNDNRFYFLNNYPDVWLS